MKIIQLVNGYSKGDGVGNVVTAIDKLLKSVGYDTAIYNQTLNYVDLKKIDFSGDNIVLYHVALSVDPLVVYLKCKKVLVFHNITDPELLLGTGLQEMRNLCSAGLYDVSRISDYFDAAVVFSDYSKRTLVESGWDEGTIYKIPILVRFENLAMEYEKDLVEKYTDGYTNIIFTGRIFPNKKQEDIICAFAKYKEKYNSKARLFIVGSQGNSNYYNALKRLVDALELEESVIFTGRVPFSEYLAYYHLADVFLCMSAHEGFCIPLVEALYFKVPIIAVNSTAIPDTLNGSGVLLESRDPDIVAGEINKLVSDDKYRKHIIAGEEKRLQSLMPQIVVQQYMDVLKCCIEQQSVDKVRYKVFPENSLFYDGISFCEAVKNEGYQNVIYGMGAAGHRLVNYMESAGIEFVGVCDQGKGGTCEGGLRILRPEDALKDYPSANYIISVQDRKVLKDVMEKLISGGLRWNQVFVYDEIKGAIY